jgi:hypothetical protein
MLGNGIFGEMLVCRIAREFDVGLELERIIWGFWGGSKRI